MNVPRPAKLIIPFGIFIILLITSSLDFALITAFSVYFFLSQIKYLWLFIISPIVFLVDFLLSSFDIHSRFINDLTIDAYILFLTGVVLYLKSRKDFIILVKKFSQYIFFKQKLFSKKNLLNLGISLLISILLLPVLGGYLALLSGYTLYSYLKRQFNGKIAIFIGCIFLSISLFFLITGKSKLAESLETYIFLFLVIGTFQEIINLIGIQNMHLTSAGLLSLITSKRLRRNFTATKSSEKGSNNEFMQFSFKKSNLKMPKNEFIHLIHDNLVHSKRSVKVRLRLILIGFLTATVVFLIVYYLQIFRHKFSFSKLNLNFKIPVVNFISKKSLPTPIPTTTVIPSLPPVSPTPTAITKISSQSALLKIKVLNGTDIKGLAGTISGELKKMGFQNIEIGNAQSSDYKTWEVSLKKEDTETVQLLKNILKLETLTVKIASKEAEFDLTFIAGEKR